MDHIRASGPFRRSTGAIRTKNGGEVGRTGGLAGDEGLCESQRRILPNEGVRFVVCTNDGGGPGNTEVADEGFLSFSLGSYSLHSIYLHSPRCGCETLGPLSGFQREAIRGTKGIIHRYIRH